LYVPLHPPPRTKSNPHSDKVIDSSDVILHVLDARDPLGTRCRHVEKYLAAEAPHKHLVFVLNKIDLVPSKTAVSTCLLFSLYQFSAPANLSYATFWHPRGFVRASSAFVAATMEVVRYTAGRMISTFHVLGLVIRLRAEGLRLGGRHGIPDVFLMS
jgi:hypothetical protein